MKHLKFLLIAFAAICALTSLNACEKKDGAAGQTGNENPYPYNSYNNNNYTSVCSSDMVYQYQEMIYVCNTAYSWNQRQDCRYLIEQFIYQYPAINCVNQNTYSGNYSYKTQRSKAVSISSDRLRKKLKQMK
jgi:hypothetical protein